jgi:hypothetical protein
MGMFSEVATEGTIRAIVKAIDRALEMEPDSLVRKGLLRAQLIALGEFDWDTPAWGVEKRQAVKAALEQYP